MKPIILEEIKELKKYTDTIIDNNQILERKQIEEYLKNIEKLRYSMFNKLKINNKNEIENKIDYINENYKANYKDNILKIYIPEVIPKFKNINNFAYKNIMISTAEAIKEYENLFGNRLTFVLIIVHENQVNMDIDNKFVKPIIDALALQKVIHDDNVTNMFYMVQGKNDTNKPFTEVYVMDAKYVTNWIENLENMFKKMWKNYLKLKKIFFIII